MATNSYPAVGENGLTEAQWSVMNGSQDGIIEDFVGNAGGIVRSNVNDECTIRPVKIKINGYVLDVTADHVLPCNPVTGSPVTYYVAAVYDPATNVADGSGQRSTLGPVTLQMVTSLSTSGGKQFYVLYSITRSPSQVLTAAPLVDARSWIAETITVPKYLSGTLQGPFPRGTVLIQTEAGADTGDISIRIFNGTPATPGLAWKSITKGERIPIPLPSGLVAQDQTPYYWTSGGRTTLEGAVRRTTGAALNNGSDVILGTLPEGNRPGTTRRFACAANGGGYKTGYVKVDSAGVITMYDPPAAAGNITWLDLSSISYRTDV